MYNFVWFLQHKIQNTTDSFGGELCNSRKDKEKMLFFKMKQIVKGNKREGIHIQILRWKQ